MALDCISNYTGLAYHNIDGSFATNFIFTTFLLLFTIPTQYVQNLQQVVDDYYDKCTAEAMTWLEQQAFEILDVMYDSVTKHNFDSVSDDVDRVSDAVDNNSDKIDIDSIKLPYDSDNNITTGSTKCERNMTDILKDTDTKDKVRHDKDDNTMTKVKWSTETNDIDN